MPPTRTETELARAVLQQLGVIGAEQAPSAADLADTIDAYRMAYAYLNETGKVLVYWNRAEIPQAVFHIMRDFVALELQTTFGQPITAPEKKMAADAILINLRAHVARLPSGLPARSDYM